MVKNYHLLLYQIIALLVNVTILILKPPVSCPFFSHKIINYQYHGQNKFLIYVILTGESCQETIMVDCLLSAALYLWDTKELEGVLKQRISNIYFTVKLKIN